MSMDNDTRLAMMSLNANGTAHRVTRRNRRTRTRSTATAATAASMATFALTLFTRGA